MKLDIHLRQQSSSDNLPNETQDQMFPSLSDIARSDVHDGTSDTFRRRDDDIVVFCNLECVEGFTRGGFVEDTGVDGVGDGVIDEFAEDETVFTVVEELHCLCWDGEAVVDVWIVLDNLFGKS
jgi:hypothetical protein